MLNLKNRLKLQKDFEAVFKQGRGFNSTDFFLKFTKNNLPDSRFGFVISNKVSKKAVERNKIKRQLREIIRLNINSIKPGFDFVFVCKAAVLNLKFDYHLLEKEILNSLRKIKKLS